MSSLFRTLASAGIALSLAVPAAGQQASSSEHTPPGEPTPVGWSFTPALGAAQSWDDNVLLRGRDEPSHDFVSVLNPRADLGYNGPHTQLGIRYDSSVLFYRTLDSLDAYDQHGSFSVRRRVSPHYALVLEGNGATSQTTELFQLTGVPYVRVGSKTDGARAGVEAMLSRHSTLTVAGYFEQVHFDEARALNPFLLSGRTYGGTVAFDRQLSERTTLTADYDASRADMGFQHARFFVHNVTVGVDRRLSGTITLSAAGGVSILSASALAPAHTGPSLRLGVSRVVRTSALEVRFSQSYVPSWGFGGTTQHQELSTTLGIPLTPRLYATSLAAWRRDHQLVAGSQLFQSLWLQGAIGYSMTRWARVEGFFAGTYQTFNASGHLAHNQLGVQVIATKPVRIH